MKLIVTSKNGVKLELSPKHWWNILDWVVVFEQAEIIKNHDIHMDVKGWKMISRSCE